MEAEPYKSDHDYLDAEFARIRTLASLYKLRSKIDPLKNLRQCSKENIEGQSDEDKKKADALEEQLNEQEAVCRARITATRREKDWRPRLEAIVEQHDLDAFERDVLLLLAAYSVSPIVRNALSTFPNVDDVLGTLARDLSERIECRRYFYRDATLVESELISIGAHFGSLGRMNVEIEPRVLNRILGLETEATHLVDGSHLYHPTTELKQVVLPERRKERIVETVDHFEAFRRARENLGFDEKIQYGKGLVMLFYGASGTGKTMMANALANHMGRRLMLVNFSLLSLPRKSDKLLRFIFREAKMQNAVLFFDECEVVFGERNATLLTEIERHDGLIILATNVPEVLDDAMHRRITLAMPFEKPDTELRHRIWEHMMPERTKLAGDVKLEPLARRYSLTGGLIKNAALVALSSAVARDEEQPVITQADLEDGAEQQLRGHLSLSSFEHKVTPEVGLDALVVPDELRRRLDEVVALERARPVLFGRWGFDEMGARYGKGTLLLFSGPPGTGKTMAAEALGYELGRPLRRVSPAEVHSKYVGETSSILEDIFEEAAAHDAVLFFDEADALLARRTGVGSATDRYANADVNELLGLLERFDGLAVMTTNRADNLDPALRRRVRFALEFPRPDAALRRKLWRKLIPDDMPAAPNVDPSKLAEAAALTGADIRQAVYRAAARAAVRSEAEHRVTHDDLRRAAREASADTSERMGFAA
jgi:SpoVK/Ycf46/Vps4 family AAA+-type ATPase